jgi:hypothetical protein
MTQTPFHQNATPPNLPRSPKNSKNLEAASFEEAPRETNSMVFGSSLLFLKP